MAELPRLRVGLTLDSQTFVRETNRVIDSVNKLGRDTQRQTAVVSRGFDVAGRAIKTFAASFGVAFGAAGIAQLTRFGKEALDTAGNLGELAQQAGVTTSQLQELTLAGLQTGVSQEQLVTSLAQFGRRVGDAAKGTGDLKDTLKAYNIAVTDSSGRVRQEADVLKDIAEAVQNAASSQERLTLVSDAFGARIGSKLLPLLVQGGEGLERWAAIAHEVGVVLATDFIEAADSASDSIATLQYTASKGFQVGLVEEFAGAINITKDSLILARQAGEGLGRAIGGLLDGITSTITLISDLNESVRDATLGMYSWGEAIALPLTGLEALVDVMAQFFGLTKAPDTSLEALAPPEIVERIRKMKEELAGAAGAGGQLSDVMKKLNKEVAEAEFEEQIKDLSPAYKKLAEVLHSVGVEFKVFDGQVFTNKELEKSAVTLYRIYKDQIDAAEQLKKALVEVDKTLDFIDKHQALTKNLQQQLQLQAVLLRGIDKESEQYRIQAALIEAKAQVGDKLDAQEERFIRQLERQSTIIDTQTEAREEARRLAEQAEELALEPFKNALESIQNLTTDTFETIYSGGIKTFGDLADEIKRIFIRLAAELTTLALFRGVAGGAGLEGLLGLGGAAAAAAPAAGGIRTGPGGLLVGGGATSLAGPLPAAPNWWLTPQTGLGNLALAGGLGFGAGNLFGGLTGSGPGGGIGGALGAAGGLALPFGGPALAIAGGIGGGLLGGFIGGLFGGGGTGREGNIGGSPLGTISGTGKAAAFVREFDEKLVDMLDARQRAIADKFLEGSAAVSVKFQEDLSDADRARLAAGRIAPIARGLGFRAEAIADPFKSAEDQLARLAEAIDVKQQVRDLTTGFGQFAQQARELKQRFDELKASAQEFGISTKGFASAARQQGFDLIRQELAQLTGDTPSLNQQLDALNERLRGVRQAAIIFGFDLKKVEQAAAEARHELREQVAAQKEQVRLEKEQGQLQVRQTVLSLSGRTLTFAQQLEQLKLQFAAVRVQAIKYGVSIESISKTYKTAVALLKEQQHAQENALALSVREPFKQLVDPLQEFLGELTTQNLNPLQQAAEAQKEFLRIANLAKAGSTIAISQLQGAGEAFIRTAEQVGASPARAAAIEQVADVTRDVIKEIQSAQADASRGLEDVIRRASREEVDTLKEVVAGQRELVAEIKRLRRS